MNDQTDSQLLRAYVEHRSEPAFTELVRRHLDIVLSAALRMVCDSHLAQDVTQGVFVALARNAAQLKDRPVLSGWLHRTAQNIAAQTVRTDVRRRVREQEVAAMNELLSAEPDVVWEHIAPHLDSALGELSEPDRDALMLRYFERKSAGEMAAILGISDEAAQKRVSRAVERLREFFARRGITVGASGLVVVISANAVQAAPVGLAVTISTAALIAGTTISTTVTATAIKTIAMTTVKKTLITAALVAAVALGIYKAHEASTLHSRSEEVVRGQSLLTPEAGLNGCINNLRTIEAMRQQCALEKRLTATNIFTAQLILPYSRYGILPRCPSGGTYTFESLDKAPTCSIRGHVLTPIPPRVRTADEQVEFQALTEAINAYKRDPDGPAPKEFPKELGRAWKLYHTKNPGQKLKDLSDIEPYTTTPDEADALHRLLEALKE